MKVRIIQARTEATQDFVGEPEAVRLELLTKFGQFLPRGVKWRDAKLNSILHAISRQEAFFVHVLES